MSQVRRLCANCLCYHCEQFVLPPEPFNTFTLPIKQRISEPQTSLEYSQSQAIQTLTRRQNQQLQTIINRANAQTPVIIPQTPIKRANIYSTEQKLLNHTVSTERNERTNHHGLSSQRNYGRTSTPKSREIISTPRSASMQILRNNVFHVVPPPPQSQIIGTYTTPFTFQLASPSHTITSPQLPHYLPSRIPTEAERKKSIAPEKVEASNAVPYEVPKVVSNVVDHTLQQNESVPSIPNQFLKTKFQQMPNFGNLKDKSRGGLTHNPSLVPEMVNIARRKRVQKCSFNNNRCLGVDLCCDTQNEIIVDQTGHVKQYLQK